MTSQIQEALCRLHKTVNTEEVVALVEDIRRTCQEHHLFSETDIGYVTSLLTSGSQSLVSFLQGFIGRDKLNDAKCKSLELMIDWFDQSPAQFQQCAVAIKDVGFQIFCRDKFAKARCLGLVLLSKVLDARQGTPESQDFGVPALVDRLYLELGQTTSMLKPTVKEEILCTLGLIAKGYPDAVRKYRDRLLSVYISELNVEMTGATRRSHKNIIAGCLHGLSGFMYHFTVSFEEDPDSCYKIFKCIRMAVSPNENLRRYDIPKAALMLLSRHAAQFGLFLFEGHVPMYRNLAYWSKYHNRDMKQAGMAALEAFLREVSSALLQCTNKEDGMKMFEFFIQEFKKTMTSESNLRDLTIALKGYGMFAAPCRYYLKESDIFYMLTDIISRSENVFQNINNPGQLEDNLPLLMSFQEATASILQCARQVPGSQLASLEKLTVLQIQNFPFVPENLTWKYCKSLACVLLFLQPLAPSSVSQIVYQGVIRTCSHPIAADVEAADDGGSVPGFSDPRKVTYKRYLHLWNYLLDAVHIKELNQLDVPLEARHKFVAAVYDALVSAVMEIISKLNLSVKKKAEVMEVDGVANLDADPVKGAEATCPYDFNIFINLVDFFRDTFTTKCLEHFCKWTYVMIRRFIELSTKNPLVSGFYKALTACLSVCAETFYFEKSSEEPRSCLKLVSKFTREVLARFQQFQDDLLVACLDLILHLPAEVVEADARALVPAFRVALQQGLSYLPLARSAVKALKVWEKRLPSELVAECFRNILPCLKPYLALGVRNDSGECVAPQPVAKRQSRKKIALKVLYKKSEELKKLQQTELETVQLDILGFLGSLAGDKRAALLSDLEAEMSKAAIAWDSNTREHLVFALPFVDVKAEIALDAFLPRVAELARFASRRQTKVASCELLHSLVLYMIGVGVQASENRRAKFPMDSLYKHLFPELLHLACDPDQVTKSLFEPLLLQMMHWFSSRSTVGSRESVTIVECLWDTLTQPQETVLRDFAGRCLREFVQWSIKQSSVKEQEKNPVNMKAVLKRLYSYCRHPNAYKRMGAALAFNNIYTIIREEESIVDIYILEVLFHFVNSLKLAHADEKSLGTQELCCRALDIILRILTVKSGKLSAANKKRRWPGDAAEQVTLSDAAEWLLCQTSCPQEACRRKCMELALALVPRLPGFSSFEVFMTSLSENHSKSCLVEILEQHVTLADATFHTVSAVKRFCDRVIGVLECYTWLFQQKLLKPGTLFRDEKTSSVLFSFVETFLEKLAVKKVSKVLLDAYTPAEEVAFNYAKCSVTVRLFNFLTALLENYPDQFDCVPDTVWMSDMFWNCALLCVLDPTEVGFDLADLEVMSKLPSEILSFLQQVSKVLPASYQRRFRSSYDRLVSSRPEYHASRFLSLQVDDSNSRESNMLHLIGLTSGYRLLAESQLVSLDRSIGLSAVDVVLSVLRRNSEPLPLEKELCFQVLELTVAFKADSRRVLTKLLGEQPRATRYFGHELSQHIVGHSDVCIPALLCLVSNDVEQNMNVVQVLSDALTFVTLRKELVSLHGTSVVSALMTDWSKLKPCWAHNVPQQQANDSALLLNKLLCLCSEVSIPRSTFVDLFVDAFVMLLRRGSAKLGDKVAAMEMLPLLAEDERPAISAKLREALEEMAAQHFPLECSDLLPGSLDFLAYTAALNKLVNAVETSGNPVLLDLAVRIIYRERNHFMEEEFLSALRRMAGRSSETKQTHLVRATYKLFVDNPSLPTHLRLAVAQKVLCMLLKRCSKSTLRIFFAENAADMIDTIAARLVSSSDSQIVSKMGAFACLEDLYSRLRKDEVMGQQSEINAAFCKARRIAAVAGNELTKEVTRCASSTKRDDARGETKFLDLRLGLRCAAYNTLAAVITCTQVEPNFYDVFLLQEKPEKGEYLWNNLVDSGITYEFPLERDVPTRRKKQLIGTTESVPESTDVGRRQPRHVQATLLSGSSLAKDATQFSLSLSEQAFFRANKCDVDSPTADVKDKVFERMKFVDLEDDELNNHQCMASVCYMFSHMADVGIVPKEVKVEDAAAPKWLTNIINALVGDYMTKNALLFLIRALVNSAEVLTPYSHHLVPPLLEVIASQRLGSVLDSFVIDVVVTILVWSSSYETEELLQRCNNAKPEPVLDFLVDHCAHERRDVLRNNLEVIRWFLELWRPLLTVPYVGVMRHLSRHTTDSKDTSGLSLLGMFLANDIVVFNQESKSDICRVLSALPKMLLAKYRFTYKVAAEVVGMTLRKMNDAGHVDDTFVADVMSRLRDLSNEREDQFVICLHEICQFYDPIADRFCDKLILMLPLALSTFKESILEIIASCCSRAEDPVRKLFSAGFLDFLDHGSDKAQRASLEICTALVTQITPDQWHQILPIVCRLQAHSSSACRKLVYNVCMLVYDRFRLTSDGESLKEQAKKVLVLGLADAEVALRLLVGNFWSREEHLPKQTTERLVALLKQTYVPESEANFLRSVCFLLLEMTSLSPDYSRKVFQHPLSDCQFVDYNVTGSWRQRHAAMTPLFAETLSASQTLSQAQSDIIAGRTLDMDQIRATAASLQFTPTQDVKDEKGKGTFNWLTQSTFEMSTGDEPRPSTSSRLFAVGRSKSNEQEGIAQKGPCWAKEIRYLRRRFVKDDEKVRQQYIRQEVRRKERRKELEKEQKARREAEVTLYRRYRLGELPDIEIPHSAIIAPLQALAEEDQQVAQMLITAITQSLLKDARRKNSSIYSELCRELQDSFLRLLDESLDYSSSVVGFVLEVSFQHPADIRLRADSLAWASVAGNHQNLGILLLEEMQLHSAEPSAKAPKRCRKEQHSESSGASLWIKLAELYKSLDDSDAVRGVFECAGDISPGARAAFEKEVLGDYQAAVTLYEELYQKTREVEPDEATFYDDAVLESCCNLGDWDGLERVVASRIGKSKSVRLEDLFDFAYKQDHYLPSLFKSKVMTSLIKGKNDCGFLESVRSALDDTEKKRVLESNLTEQLALVYAIERDYSRSRYYVENLREQFLQEWSSLSVLNPSVLDRNLQSLQKIADLLDYLYCNMTGGSEDRASTVLKNWKKRLPSDCDTVSLWTDVLTTRCYFIKTLCDTASDKFLPMKIDLLNSFARAAINRNTVPVALRCVAQIEKLKSEAGECSVDMSYVHTYCATLERSCERLPPEKKIASHIKMLQKLETCVDASDNEFVAKTSALEGHLLTRLSELLYSAGSDAQLRLNPEETAILKLSKVCSTSQQTAYELREKAFCKYQEAISKSAAAESSKQQSIAHISMATFCNQVLQCWEGGALDFESRKECPKVMVDSVLSSMALGNTDAVDMFPQLLDVIQVHKACRETFAAQCVKVPCWMYLSWLNQILPMLDKEIGPYLFDLVDAVATHYPNALVYPFRVSYESYKFESSGKSQSRDFVERVKVKMDRLPLVNDFIAALRMLQFPDIAFKDWHQTVEEALKQKKSSQSLKREFREMLSDLCEEGSVNISGVRQRFAKAVKKKLVDAFGSNGEKLASMSPNDFRAKCRQIMGSYKIDKPTSLKDISPWLAKFSMLQHSVGLEIPGQYTGKCKPMPEYHVQISGFDEKILVLSSKQRPCRVTVQGNDEREYRFLVKTGEDLRQDDRIERLFQVMNRAFAADPICRAKRLHLVTYKVVPLTTRVGLIEWLSNTVVLREFIQKGMDDAEVKIFNQLPTRSGLSGASDYIRAYEQLKTTQLKSAFHKNAASVDRKALYKAFLNLSSCFEAFFTLRSRFVASHAAICIAHWVLGIGDRHLENFLVNVETGQEVGIDFGYAFGVATQFLPVPELMPFRLTPQYLSLTDPLRQHGGYSCSMQHVLRVLRSNRQTLLNVLDVFVKEPTVDWMRYAKMQSVQTGESSERNATGADDGSEKWYPRQKVCTVREKLGGRHPSYIFRDEVRLRKEQRQNMEVVCLGTADESKHRGQISDSGELSVEEQVECLIEQASDPLVLGLTWCGWMPWT
ncbi:DNA-dependent protein kinase catalytic subunit-like [Ornithodoros turicata]|uniref:DNA-dependent protein kinase catalytic subunit-like n=1 Tax=Ornithodoros turicata TaxID=34597 RepID=UPI003139A4A7